MSDETSLTPNAVLGAGTSILGNIINAYTQNKINQQNLAYAEQQTAITREREDNALQRKVADAKAAGLSPLAALGSTGAQASNALNYSAQAPQMDFTGVISSLINADDINQRKAELKETKNYHDLLHQETIAQLTQEYKMFGEKQNQELYMFNQNLALQLDQLKVNKSQLNYQHWKDLQDQTIQSADKMFASHGVHGVYKYVKDWNKYQSEFTTWTAGWAQALKDCNKEYPNDSHSSSYNQSEGYSNAFSNSNSLEANGKAFGVGGGTGSSMSHMESSGGTSGSGSSYSEETKSQANRYLSAWIASHPMPVYQSPSFDYFYNGGK